MSEEREGDKNPSSLTSTILSKYTGLKKWLRSVEAERDELKEKVLDLVGMNEDLRGDLAESQRVERFYSTSGALADREVLRERLRQREERVAELTTLLEVQETTIGDLTAQLHWISSSCAAKETMLTKDIEEMRVLLYEKSNQIDILEDKLHRSDLLIQELERLKQNYRLACTTLNDHMLCYKKQFKAVVACSENLLAEREKCKKELEEKGTTIKKLSTYPQSPKTFIYLSQIVHLLNASEKAVSDDTESIFSFVPSIKRIVESIRKELWNDENDKSLVEMENIKIQAKVDQSDSSSQFEVLVFFQDKSTFADIPGRFFFECLQLKKQVESMKSEMAEMETAKSSLVEVKAELESQLSDMIATRSQQEEELREKQKDLETHKKKLSYLKGELEYTHNLLSKAMSEADLDSTARDLTFSLMHKSLESTLHEYSKCCEVIGSLADISEQNLQIMENRWNEVIEKKNNMEEVYVMKLKHEMERQHEMNVAKDTTITELKTEVSKLRNQLSEKTLKFKVIQEKLLKAEQLFEEIDSLNYRQTEFDMSDPDLVVVKTSEKILEYSEIMGQQWKNKIDHNVEVDYSQSFVRKTIRHNRVKNKQLKETIRKLTTSTKKLRRTVKETKRKIKNTNQKLCDSVKNLQDLKILCGQLKGENCILADNLNDKIQELEKGKLKLIENDSKYNSLEYEKEKMEEVLLKIIKDLEFSYKQETKSLMVTETGIGDLKFKDHLTKMVFDLQERMESLMNIPERESDVLMASVSLQASIEPEIDNLKEGKYNEIVENLKQDLRKEKALSVKRMKNNEKLKETKENEIKQLNVEHKKAITLLRDEFHKEKIEMYSKHSKQLKRLQARLEQVDNAKREEGSLKKPQNFRVLQEKYEKLAEQTRNFEGIIKEKESELVKQKLHYENVIAQKDSELHKEINELKIDIQNIITKKEEMISKVQEMSLQRVSRVKKQLKIVNKKLKNEKFAMARKMEVMKQKLLEVGINKIDDGSQTYVCSDINSQTDLSFVDVASQSVFFYTHHRTIEVEVQASVRTVESGSQTEVGSGHTNSQTQLAKDGRPDRVPSPRKGNVDHVVFAMPSARKDISINFKERIKCSIKGAFLNQISSLSDIRDISLHRDKNELANAVAYLESELMKKTEDFNRNVEMYQSTIRRQRAKIEELEKLLDEEVMDTYKLRNRLAIEFKRTEQLISERKEFQICIGTLQNHIRSHESDCQTEREKSIFWKKHFESTMSQRKESDELEVSLKRLQEKMDRAVNYEKKLIEDMKVDNTLKELKARRMSILGIDSIRNRLSLESSKEIDLADKYSEPHDEKTVEDDKTKNSSCDVQLFLFQNSEAKPFWQGNPRETSDKSDMETS